jgi:hypothetical protein
MGSYDDFQYIQINDMVNVTIIGTGHGGVTLDGFSKDRLFFVGAGHLELIGVVLTNGNGVSDRFRLQFDAHTNSQQEYGGAVYIDGSAVFTNCTFASNSAANAVSCYCSCASL